MNFIEPKVEFITLNLEDVVFRSGPVSGPATGYCYEGTTMDGESCAAGSDVASVDCADATSPDLAEDW